MENDIDSQTDRLTDALAGRLALFAIGATVVLVLAI